MIGEGAARGVGLAVTLALDPALASGSTLSCVFLRRYWLFSSASKGLVGSPASPITVTYSARLGHWPPQKPMPQPP